MPLIEVKGLCKSFGERVVLEDVNLEVSDGERIAIIGESGCGKSVFLRCLELLTVPDRGQILIDGQEITAKGADVDRIRRSMGMVYQKFHLFSHMNVMDNLCLAPVRLLGMTREAAEEKAMDLLSQVSLSTRANDFPEVLSGGQQQRIAICRSLMMDPKVLLFDEPTSALDPTMVGEVLAVIRMLSKRHLAMLIVTHEMSFARELADRVLFFAEHGIYEQGPPAEVFEHPKRAKTVAFIQKIKYFSFEITSRKFDLMKMQGGLLVFGEKYGMRHKRIGRLQLCCEELVYEMMAQCYAPEEPVSMQLAVSYAEADGRCEIELTCSGKEYNPFAQEEDELGVTILKKMAARLEYAYDGRSRISILL